MVLRVFFFMSMSLFGVLHASEPKITGKHAGKRKAAQGLEAVVAEGCLFKPEAELSSFEQQMAWAEENNPTLPVEKKARAESESVANTQPDQSLIQMRLVGPSELRTDYPQLYAQIKKNYPEIDANDNHRVPLILFSDQYKSFMAPLNLDYLKAAMSRDFFTTCVREFNDRALGQRDCAFAMWSQKLKNNGHKKTKVFISEEE